MVDQEYPQEADNNKKYRDTITWNTGHDDGE